MYLNASRCLGQTLIFYQNTKNNQVMEEFHVIEISSRDQFSWHGIFNFNDGKQCFTKTSTSF